MKVGIASTLHYNLIVGARTFKGNPYDGHTLAEQMEQMAHELKAAIDFFSLPAASAPARDTAFAMPLASRLQPA